MIELKERSKKTVRREVFEFDEEYGYWQSDTWTRVTVDGELNSWVPHDDYGELPNAVADDNARNILEQAYQESDYV